MTRVPGMPQVDIRLADRGRWRADENAKLYYAIKTELDQPDRPPDDRSVLARLFARRPELFGFAGRGDR